MGPNEIEEYFWILIGPVFQYIGDGNNGEND
jgi:hypothetical protein